MNVNDLIIDTSDEKKLGKVYWITGLAGAGKSFLSRTLYEHLKKKNPFVILLDGDILREVFGAAASYTLEDRFTLAMKYARLCHMLAEQGATVICATISMFDACRTWNRENIPQYCEIYIRVPLDILIQRDQKSLYSKALRGEALDVMGINLAFEEPKEPDWIIDNDGQKSLDELCHEFCCKFNI